MDSASSLRPGEVWTSELGSMAADTARNRWPKIVQSIIDDVKETIEETRSREQETQGFEMLRQLNNLKSEIEQNEELSPLPPDGTDDVEEYNKKLASFRGVSWNNCPWMFSECYLYRRVHCMATSQHAWKGYDIFARQKLGAFISSATAVRELSDRFMGLVDSDAFRKVDGENLYLLFTEMTEVTLWGNATDLSLLNNLSLAQIQSLQGSKAIREGQSRIVSNDTSAVFGYLKANPAGRVDIVLDNAGFEFLTDLVYSLFLLETNLARSVALHVKSIPWFVSDVMPRDLDVLLLALSNAPEFQNDQHKARRLADQIRESFRSGQMTLVEHKFWTSGFDFQDMPSQASDLFQSLQASTLVVFKGDLNYRKLVRDAKWSPTTSFKDALGPLSGRGARDGKCDNAHMRILALRTNKADVCVGVDEKTLRRLENEAPGRSWTRNGKYAVVSFSDGL